MKLNPLDIYNKEFKKSTFGYNTTQVDEFLDDVGVAYERLLKDLNKLQEENKNLKEKIDNYQDMEDKLQNTLDSMQDTISDRIEQADKEARMIVKDARMKAEKIKNDAQEEVASEKRKLEQLREQKSFFKIRFKTLLESHLEMLNQDEEESLRGEFEDSEFELKGEAENEDLTEAAEDSDSDSEVNN